MTTTIEAAQTDLYHTYHAAIVRYAARILQNSDDAEDVAQATFTEAVAHWIDGIDHPKAWLYQIAQHKAIDLLRHKRLITWHSLEALAEVRQFAVTDSDLGMVEVQECITAAMAHLSAHNRLLIQTYVIDDKSLDETARITGHPAGGGVKMAITRARQELRRALKEMEEN